MKSASSVERWQLMVRCGSMPLIPVLGGTANKDNQMMNCPDKLRYSGSFNQISRRANPCHPFNYTLTKQLCIHIITVFRRLEDHQGCPHDEQAYIPDILNPQKWY